MVEPQLKSIPVDLNSGMQIRIQARALDDSTLQEPAIGDIVESDVSVRQRLQDVSDAIVTVAQTMKGAVDAVKPTKASIEFGLEFEFEAGQLTALLVQGSEKANLKIALEWESDKK